MTLQHCDDCNDQQDVDDASCSIPKKTDSPYHYKDYSMMYNKFPMMPDFCLLKNVRMRMIKYS